MAVAESLKALVIAAVVIDSVGLGLRSFARARVQGSFGYDDAVLSLSLIGYIIFVSFTLVALHYGYGVLTPEPWHDSTQAIKIHRGGTRPPQNASKFKEIENNLTVIAWTHVEIFLAILATSLIAVRPLLKRAGELIDTWRRGRTSSPSKAEEEHELANDRVRSGSSRSRDQEENGYSSEVSLGNDGERVKLPHM
ncbi:hypothetical protein NUW58_g895 [Xylaria curta]|uniref:Uncharacterized protein n=1 Tax=Xylaria curta TaxID=42375 RepID=A0ACC1PML3_9PEZI|nr:hypothetical protein NUW58_g895 [Xylaria curta]